MTRSEMSLHDVQRLSNNQVDHETAETRFRNSKAEPIQFPDGWTETSSWRRAQSSSSTVAPISLGDYTVLLGYPESPGYGDRHNVSFAILDGRLAVHCSCDGYHYRQWCSHVGHLWWLWVRDRLVVHDFDTSRYHRTPPSWLTVGDGDD